MTTLVERHKKRKSAFRGWLTGRHYYKAAEAMHLVEKLETGFRKDGETPKFDHQLTIARVVSTLEPHLLYPEETIIAAFLHDLIEDHEYDLDFVNVHYGSRVWVAIEFLTKKNGSMSKNWGSYIKALDNCPIASIVKLADRLHNLQTMQGAFTIDKQRSYLSNLSDFFDMARNARRQFPSQYMAYENLCMMLRIQEELIGLYLAEMKGHPTIEGGHVYNMDIAKQLMEETTGTSTLHDVMTHETKCSECGYVSSDVSCENCGHALCE